MTRRSTHDEEVEIEGEVRARTDLAVLFFDGSREVWLPLSKVELAEDEASVLVPEWLALREGLI
jgi:hypothetical protein